MIRLHFKPSSSSIIYQMLASILQKFSSAKLILHLAICFILLSQFSCSSGGGSSSGSSRSTRTAVRIFHGGLDAAPLGLFLGEEFLGETRFMGESVFTPVSPQITNLRLTRTNRFAEPVTEFPVTLALDTEYSVFAYGQINAGTFRVKLLEEAIIRPEEGFARVQFLNALNGASSARFAIVGVEPRSVPFGQTSGFFEISSGVHSLVVSDVSGRPVSNIEFEAKDRGEVSIMLAGRTDYGFVQLKLYEDFD